jgi:DNA-directed RNA polymerase subunit RPC12/RpoP
VKSKLRRFDMTATRIKVSIRCKKCGDRFILKGRKEKGKVDTGFIRCLCNNENEFDIEMRDY